MHRSGAIWRILLLLSALVILIPMSAIAAPSERGTTSFNNIADEKKVASAKICVLNEPGGMESPLNRSIAEGVDQASRKLHVDVNTRDAATPDDLGPNLETFVSAGDCDLILGVGFLTATPIYDIAWAYPEQRFSIIDSGMGDPPPNVAELAFLTHESSFLAGYIAAGISETGKVGVFGGFPIEPVTMFMDGYALGVDWFNTENAASVEVLGWDPVSRSGAFAFDWITHEIGQEITSDLYDEGADAVFAVAGMTGFGALDEANLRKAAGQDVRVVGVDFDWYEEFGDGNRVILTSVVKEWGLAAYAQIEALVDGTWEGGGQWVGLDGGFVDIAPFHKLNNQVPGYLKNDLKGIIESIIDGSISTSPP